MAKAKAPTIPAGEPVKAAAAQPDEIPVVQRVPSHITIDDRGNARIDGMRFKVIQLGEAVRTGLDTPQKLHDAFPQLTMAQICSGLAYYYEHRPEIDAQIDCELREFERKRAAAPETPGRKKLRQQGYLP